jgi:hypothetical protein
MATAIRTEYLSKAAGADVRQMCRTFCCLMTSLGVGTIRGSGEDGGALTSRPNVRAPHPFRRRPRR